MLIMDSLRLFKTFSKFAQSTPIGGLTRIRPFPPNIVGGRCAPRVGVDGPFQRLDRLPRITPVLKTPLLGS